VALRKFGLYCGVIGPILWLVLIVVGGALRPGFSHITQYISELGERGSSTEALMRYGAFAFTGFLYVCFAGGLLATFRNGWPSWLGALLIALDGVGRIGAGVFPCNAGCIPPADGPNLHRLFATIGFCAGILATFLWAVLFRRVHALRSLSPFSFVSGGVALVSLLLMSQGAGPAPLHGLFEHLATIALSVWVLVFARRLVRRGSAER
jgi:hypothetical membrane protein